MSRKEIPSQDPELGPDETPVSPEAEWLARELQGGLDPKTLQKLKGVEVTFTDPEPGLATKKGKRVSPAVSPANPEKVSEVLIRDMNTDWHALKIALSENATHWQALKEAAEKAGPDSFTGKDRRKKMLLLSEAERAIRLGLDIVEQIRGKLGVVPLNDPNGAKLYSLGAWITSETLRVTREVMYSEDMNAAQGLNLRLGKLLLNFMEKR